MKSSLRPYMHTPKKKESMYNCELWYVVEGSPGKNQLEKLHTEEEDKMSDSR